MRTALILIILRCMGFVVSICVFDNKKGWWLDCGIRDSYLFRLKDFGGFQANFDVGFGFGDEKGFPNSISKTNHKAKGHSNTYLPPPPVYPPGYGTPGGYGYYKRADNQIPNRRSDFPYKFEAPTPSAVKVSSRNVKTNQVAHNYYYNKKPQYQPAVKPTQRQGIQYVNSQRSNYNSQYKKPETPYRTSQNYHPNHYNSKPLQPTFRPYSSDQKYQQSWNQQANSKPYSSDQKYQQSWSQQGNSNNGIRRTSQVPQYTNSANKFSYIPPNPPNPLNRDFRSYENNRVQDYSPKSHLVPPPLPPPPLPPPQQYNQNQLSRQDNNFLNSGIDKQFVFRVPTTTTPPPPTVGPEMSQLLNVPVGMDANSDNVPSFAAKMFVVREAPFEYYPPHYDDYNPHRPRLTVQIPRTKFYCEEQKYLPGIYADSMLGCKMFHLCVPSSVGSTLTSYLCPNGTLFDQSILQCNYWYNVDCESSSNDYDANLALALSYRRINAAHMPIQAATNAATLSLLSQNIDQLQVANPKKAFSKRMGRMLDDFRVPVPKTSSVTLNATNIVQIPTISDSKKSLQSSTLANSSNKSQKPSFKSLLSQIQDEFKVKKSNRLHKLLSYTKPEQSFRDKSEKQVYFGESSWRPL